MAVGLGNRILVYRSQRWGSKTNVSIGYELFGHNSSFRMFSLLMQLAFGLMIELIVPALGLAVLLPKFIGAVDDFFFAGLFHCVLSWSAEHGPVRLRWGLVGSGAAQPRYC